MARARSDKIADIKTKIVTRLREGLYLPGDRFLSARELAAAFGVSYQTAHRLLEELQAEGWLERRAASGTYIPGETSELSHVCLLFHARARRAQSFGARLLHDLTARLKRDRVAWEIVWSEQEPNIPSDAFPVLWEFPAALEMCLNLRRTALLLNARPQPGMGAAFLDSVSVDDYFGGVCAAELLLRDTQSRADLAVLTGPEADARSNARRDGFLSLAKNAAIICADGWFFEEGLRVAGEALRRGTQGIFCCNDRLAEAVIAHCKAHRTEPPRLVGFDDAPVAESLNLTTIAIPWEELTAEAMGSIKRRLNGDRSAARQLLVTPRPVIRKL